ncbi:DUF302 domain-containing protein [Ruegeria sp.]|uniref:DUF302 domain-containing protein n=1 Tax=Ruegeria sp. TaxID=1879320 RepID=UPI002328987D|nr:DUF302 domain-containing protein [Ruegeria sp.]MDA7965627.1 DUF302 domain-containing protein [Ruegeria sp.]MDA7967147.1 DUF302 domain-containing protein [Ruegeria sp.]
MRKLILTTTFIFGGTVAAMADDIIKVSTDKSVPEALDALEAAVGNAGATVFARVDHAAGAEKVGLSIPANQVLIFGNPALGTPAMQLDPRAGLFLPLKVQAYEDANGQVWLAYEDPKETMDELDAVEDAPVIEKMRGALAKLTSVAAQ